LVTNLGELMEVEWAFLLSKLVLMKARQLVKHLDEQMELEWAFLPSK
jgi:hypothetical protein